MVSLRFALAVSMMVFCIGIGVGIAIVVPRDTPMLQEQIRFTTWGGATALCRSVSITRDRVQCWDEMGSWTFPRERIKTLEVKL